MGLGAGDYISGAFFVSRLVAAQPSTATPWNVPSEDRNPYKAGQELARMILKVTLTTNASPLFKDPVSGQRR